MARRRKQARRIGVVDVRWQGPGLGTRGPGPDRLPVRSQQRYQSGRLAPDGVDDLLDLAGAEQGVDLRNLGAELVAIPLRHASGDHEPPALAGLLVLRHLQDGVDRFLLGLVDERARVDDEHIGFVGVTGKLMSCLLSEAQHHLGVDEVLGAAEGDQANLHQ